MYIEKIEKIEFARLQPGQVFRFRGEYYARGHQSHAVGYRMRLDWSGYSASNRVFLPTTKVVPSNHIETGPLPTPRRKAT